MVKKRAAMGEGRLETAGSRRCLPLLPGAKNSSVSAVNLANEPPCFEIAPPHRFETGRRGVLPAIGDQLEEPDPSRPLNAAPKQARSGSGRFILPAVAWSTSGWRLLVRSPSLAVSWFPPPPRPWWKRASPQALVMIIQCRAVTPE